MVDRAVRAEPAELAVPTEAAGGIEGAGRLNPTLSQTFSFRLEKFPRRLSGKKGWISFTDSPGQAIGPGLFR